MNIFSFRDPLIDDYARYVQSFIRIRDAQIADHVEQTLRAGRLWPEPLLQLNPSFEPGGTIAELVEQGTLQQTCDRIFRVGKNERDPSGKPLNLHRHQTEAITIANRGENYVVTTGTGSGKSLTYIIPIIDHVLRNGSGRGIKAIVVYPMNALANSQEGELRKFLDFGFSDGRPVSFRRYTGQESPEDRQAIVADPPDVLLTNYVMLELILTRPFERKLIEAAQGLRFLVFDELHTYRGRQGADVAMLIRRIRERLGATDLQCIGTSATMSSEGSSIDRKRVVAGVAERLFGAEVKPENIVGETLRRTTPALDFDDPQHRAALRSSLADVTALTSRPFAEFINDPLCSWLETTFGLEREAATGQLVRAQPKRIGGSDGAAAALSALTEVPRKECGEAIRNVLLAGYQLHDPASGRPAFAFRLHQFISKGDAVYASLRDPGQRAITLEGQQFVPGSGRTEVLLPLAFCRECGHEYYTVWRYRDPPDGTPARVAPRRLSDTRTETADAEPGFLYASADKPWPERDSDEEFERLPDDWLDGSSGSFRLRSHYRQYRPETISLAPDGAIDGGSGKRFQFVPAPFRFCLCCGVMYPGRRNDFAKLNVFSSEGRSTSTTILSLSAVQQLRQSDLPEHARKLLSFTDNRQDAALQAGHFNDFVEIGLLRSALYRAVADAGPDGLEHDIVAQRVFDTLGLEFDEYAADPTVILQAKRQTDETLREVLGYRLYQDLKRGWRLTAPNLEQVGLLEIRYQDLDELCATEAYWQGLHPALAQADPAVRANVARVLLDAMRRQLAIKSEYLDPGFHERLRLRSSQRLRGNWALDERERLEHATVLFPRARTQRDSSEHVFLSGRSGFGRFLRRSATLPHLDTAPNLEESEAIIIDLLELLRRAGLVAEIHPKRSEGDVAGYQVYAAAMRWHAGSGTPAHDPLLMVNTTVDERRANTFFRDFYREAARHLHGIRAAEHTAQVLTEEREKREQSFREGRLPVLYCSPTMELGVDIASLNVVSMRNVPPTPANYAQRSGRAGRSGQPALVFTYCSTGNSHDQYFFKRQEQMVAGSVAAPRLDLANEELVRAHVHALWLAETGADLGRSLAEILTLDVAAGLPLNESIAADITSEAALTRARERARGVLDSLQPLLADAPWYHPEWLDEALQQVRRRFDDACNRWRDLYRAAREQAARQNDIRLDHSRPARDRKQAERLRREAESQLELLIDAKSAAQSDFYSYRYFASEGFLPGYSFPRLPLSAYIPGRLSRSGYDEYVSRPRFLAISEFGPRAVIYHDGGKYQVNRIILPPSRAGDGSVTSVAKRCEACGYLHLVREGEGPDLCELCGARLTSPMRNLLRLQNVTTKRMERINSDEEERQRLGYELSTAIRFEAEPDQAGRRHATVKRGENELAALTYGHGATLWRINLGWRHRENKHQHGFVLDLERGYWKSDQALQEQEENLESDDDPLSNRLERVIPFVEDRRNCLLWTPATPLEPAQLATLQAALKNAIQVSYQLEDSELAADALPSDHERRSILFYEAAEGGAGVLHHLLDDPAAIRRVARQALELCHFDPDSGKDRQHAPHASETCEAACYDCLMSYTNQRDHTLLDRHAIRELLLELAAAEVAASPTPRSRAEQLAYLRRLCDSELERAFLDLLEAGNHRLPSAAQQRIELDDGATVPDFVYEEDYVAIYIDGPVHDYAERHARDRELTRQLEDAGYTVLRFHHQDDWPRLLREHRHLFGGDE